MTNLFQPLLLLITGATQKELARQVRYLKVENEILRRTLPQPVLDRYRNFLANPPIEELLVLKAIRTFEFAA